MPRKYPEGKPTHSYQINTVGPNETFNEILSKAIIVTGFQQATANVEAPDPNLNYGYYKLFQKYYQRVGYPIFRNSPSLPLQ